MVIIDSQDYKQHSYREFSKIHQMTAYLAMFPPNLPHYFIEKFSQIGDKVFDPFSGRGTTAFEACRMGRVGIGNDLNPLAVCLTKSKVNIPTKKQNIFKRLQKLETQYKQSNIITKDISSDIKMLYDERTTLPQLVFLKQNLSKKRKVDNFILGILTGIMHGKHRKNGTSIYCSVDMPNTFSMSPNYVRNFIKSHKLKKPKQNVFALLEQRIKDILQEQETALKDLSHYTNGDCLKSDALDSSAKIAKKYGADSISLIITSPPYLKNIHYGKYNWIRLWLLDEDTKQVDSNVSIYHKTQKIKGIKDNLPFEKYATYMQNLFNSWDTILKPKSSAFVVIGDVEEQNLARDTWEYIIQNGGCKLKLRQIIDDDIECNGARKVTRIWGQKKGKATKIDRILWLQKE
ncbi:DNA methyltransferase [Helicobacter sp. T3_23-1056]